MKRNQQLLFLSLTSGLLLMANPVFGITIPVICGTNQVGVINVSAINQGNTNNGMSGSFTTIKSDSVKGSFAAVKISNARS